MFVTTLGMDNFDYTKMKNSQLVCGRGSFTSGNITSPTSPPYVAKQLMALFHTQPLFSSFGYCCIGKNILHILVEAQPSTQSTWPRSPTRLGIWPRDLGLLNKYSVGHCDISAASRHKVAFTRRHYALLSKVKAVSPR